MNRRAFDANTFNFSLARALFVCLLISSVARAFSGSIIPATRLEPSSCVFAPSKSGEGSLLSARRYACVPTNRRTEKTPDSSTAVPAEDRHGPVRPLVLELQQRWREAEWSECRVCFLILNSLSLWF